MITKSQIRIDLLQTIVLCLILECAAASLACITNGCIFPCWTIAFAFSLIFPHSAIELISNELNWRWMSFVFSWLLFYTHFCFWWKLSTLSSTIQHEFQRTLNQSRDYKNIKTINYTFVLQKQTEKFNS